jgi:peptidoglycan/xylan/chitin deacetylase (PgdA/CDA1 family)
MGKCIVLNYHSIIDPMIGEGHYDPIFSVPQTDFIAHLKMIKASGLKILPLQKIFDQKSSLDNYVVITFDDGHSSDYKVAFPLLKEFGITASFFLTMKNVPPDSHRWKEYKEMALHGNYIGAHGMTHQYFTNLSYAQQIYELRESKKIISEIIGITPCFYSPPGGKYNSDTIKISKSLGFKGILTTTFGICDLDNIPFLINRCTIHNKYPYSKLLKLVHLESKFLRGEIRWAKIKGAGQKILGSQFCDKINYFLRK